MALQKIGKLSLSNSGFFVAKIQIRYQVGTGEKKLTGKTGDITKGAEKTIDPAELGVPGGAMVQLYVFVALGDDIEAQQVFQYEKGNAMIARYNVSNDAWHPILSLIPWKNWSQNIYYTAPANTESYFYPRNRADLQDILKSAVKAGVKVRVSGQRHSQPPLVTDDNRSSASANPLTWLVDLSCYADLGPAGNQRMMMDPSGQKVIVNTGVLEDELDAFLTTNNKMLITVTAGGFFSLGGMTAVDVHGATVDAPIFAETTSAFTIVGPDGNVTTIDKNSPVVNGWSPLQYARVSIGALGVVTSVTVDIIDRPWATTLKPGKEAFVLNNENLFVTKFKSLVAAHSRIETFYNPYSGKFLSLWWDVDSSPLPKTPNISFKVRDSCTLAENDEYGAPLLGIGEAIGEAAGISAQESGSTLAASVIMDIAFGEIEKMFNTAVKNYSDLWLTKAARVIFMSYFVELPDPGDAGMKLVWKGLNVVTNHLNNSKDFLIVAPMEFRFIKGGNAALSGTYTDKKGSTFVNLDLIGFIKPTIAADYPAALLKFFADVEREWVAMGGITHNGKMFGFYDPVAQPGSFSAPFNPEFLKELVKRRNLQNDRVNAFEAYRRSRDPNGLFCNDYVRAMLG